MISAAAVLGVVSYFSWTWLDDALGRSFIAQIVSLGTALALGAAAYAGIVLAWGIPEARQIFELFARRVRRRS
jgi:putative peptidoglycan lipid II flippase